MHLTVPGIQKPLRKSKTNRLHLCNSGNRDDKHRGITNHDRQVQRGSRVSFESFSAKWAFLFLKVS